MRLVVDIEVNGLYQDATEIHCIVAKDIDSGKVFTVTQDIDEFCKQALPKAKEIIGHNFIDYDMRVIEKLHGVKLDVNKIIDTYLLSVMLNPSRRKHPDCPKSKLVGEKRKPIGPHSLEAWGYKVGRGKVEHEQWDKFTPNMLRRCVTDVEITELVAKSLGAL